MALPQVCLDQLGTIRLINYVRTAAAAGEDPLPALAAAASGAAAPWEDDRYLQPALMDDELMLHDWEEEDEAEAGSASNAVACAAAATDPGAAPDVAALRRENEALRGVVEALRSVVLQQDEGMRELVAEAQGSAGGAGASDAAPAQQAQQQVQQQAGQQQQGGQPRDEAARRIDDSYFDSYSAFDIHREMLADKVGAPHAARQHRADFALHPVCPARPQAVRGGQAATAGTVHPSRLLGVKGWRPRSTASRARAASSLLS